MNVEIVSHCWRYSRLLNYQLSSLIVFPPRHVTVTMTVFLTPEDIETVRVAEFFARKAARSRVTIRTWPLPKPQLMRREIGRNLAALASIADWVWFTDCDHCFGEGALDGLDAAVQSVNSPLVFPKQVLIHMTHALGDAAIARLTEIPQVASVQVQEFAPTKTRRAIGGVQIARGDVVRQRGYLKSSRIHRWTSDTWQQCIGDTWFRRDLGTRGQGVEIPSVFRIRHSKIGRRDAEVSL